MRLTSRALKTLKKIEKKAQTKIKETIDTLEKYPNSSKIRQLKNHKTASHRLRVGDFRVLMNIYITSSEIRIDILDIAHRKDIYS